MGTLSNTQGWINDGTGNLNVQGNTTLLGNTATNATTMIPASLVGSASAGSGWPQGPGQLSGLPGGLIAIPNPGFFQVPISGSSEKGQAGAGGFTGSLPSAAAFPGGDILITDTLGLWSYLLTGSIGMFASSSFNAGGALGVQSSAQGSKLTISAGGTVALWSDSKGWLVSALSGTVTLKP